MTEKRSYHAARMKTFSKICHWIMINSYFLNINIFYLLIISDLIRLDRNLNERVMSRFFGNYKKIEIFRFVSPFLTYIPWASNLTNFPCQHLKKLHLNTLWDRILFKKNVQNRRFAKLWRHLDLSYKRKFFLYTIVENKKKHVFNCHIFNMFYWSRSF